MTPFKPSVLFPLPEYAIRQGYLPLTSRVVLYLYVNYFDLGGDVLSGDYDYEKTGAYLLPNGKTIIDFVTSIVDTGSPIGIQTASFPLDSTPVLTDPGFIIFAIDPEGAGFRKELDAVTTDDSIPGEYYNLWYVQDDNSRFPGNNLQQNNPAPSPKACHVMYFSAISASTQGGKGFDDHFNLYLETGQHVDPGIKNTGHTFGGGLTRKVKESGT